MSIVIMKSYRLPYFTCPCLFLINKIFKMSSVKFLSIIVKNNKKWSSRRHYYWAHSLVALQIVVAAVLRKCSYCGRLGASVACTFHNCQRTLHHPCAAASGAFQDSKSYSLVCNLHLDQVSLMRKLTIGSLWYNFITVDSIASRVSLLLTFSQL